ncbi:DMT family transporter [Sutterella sp.]|uniref:DMT family transporter n=1 Tax=Sutterella sp. TaxID=1981025 RepID=UPI0026E02E6A|nr:DMT family transporter [Sutterella sp.]MDO5532545.1 DMT family transporter [Sutterella sp.]
MRNSWLYHFLALFVVCCWGLSFVSTKVLYGYGMGPWAVVAMRAVLAYGLLILIAPKDLFAGSVRNEIVVALVGIASVPLSYGLQNQALVTGQASTTAVLVCMGPAISGILALFALRTLKMHWMTFLGIVACATGSALVYFDAVIMHECATKGFWLGIIAACAFAFYSLVVRALGDLNPLLVLRKATGYGVIFSLPFFFNEGPTEAVLMQDPVVIGNFLFLALVVTAIGHSLWQYAEQGVGATAARAYVFLWPVVAIVAGIWMLDEVWSYIGIMGAAMILCGVFCAQTGLARVAREMAKRF